MNFELWSFMNPTIRNQDYFDACQVYQLGRKQEQEKINNSVQMADASSMFIRDEKREDWKRLSIEKKKEIISEVMDTAKNNENYLAMNILYQIILDFDERIKHLEG